MTFICDGIRPQKSHQINQKNITFEYNWSKWRQKWRFGSVVYFDQPLSAARLCILTSSLVLLAIHEYLITITFLVWKHSNTDHITFCPHNFTFNGFSNQNNNKFESGNENITRYYNSKDRPCSANFKSRKNRNRYGISSIVLLYRSKYCYQKN